MQELLYANDLLLTAETKEEMTEMFNSWRNEMEQSGLKINIDKMKVMVTGK